jgi:hypothetical protein
MKMTNEMKSNLSPKAQLVHVKIREGKTGLFYATSPELKGLLVAEPTIDALENAIPAAISDLYEVCGVSVVVTKMGDGDQDGTPWVAFPAAVAQAELNRRAAH